MTPVRFRTITLCYSPRRSLPKNIKSREFWLRTIHHLANLFLKIISSSSKNSQTTELPIKVRTPFPEWRNALHQLEIMVSVPSESFRQKCVIWFTLTHSAPVTQRWRECRKPSMKTRRVLCFGTEYTVWTSNTWVILNHIAGKF